MDATRIEVPGEWAAAIDPIASGRKRRVAVIGPADAGKSSFIRAAMSAAADAGVPLKLIDLDPGQKMLGPPGTASLGDAACLHKFIFLGSTSASEFSRIIKAAAALADDAQPFIANTSGFIRGLGARLQSWTITSLSADLIVAVGDDLSVAPVLAAHSDLQVLRLPASPLARRKSPSERTRIRQAALAQALESAERLHLDAAEVAFTPEPPAAFEGPARPICALLDARSDALSIGILEHSSGHAITVYARRPTEPLRLLQLGKIWAEPSGDGWKLLERLKPSWPQQS